MNFPGIAMLSVLLLPLALALVWWHRFAVAYGAADDETAAAIGPPVEAAGNEARHRYQPPKAVCPSDFAVATLSKAGF